MSRQEMNDKIDKEIELEARQTEEVVVKQGKWKEYKDTQKLHCAICNITCFQRSYYEAHMNGKKHRDNVALQNPKAPESPKQQTKGTPPKNTKHCDVCEINVSTTNWSHHCKTASRLNKINKVEYKCTTCDKMFNTPKAYDRHCKSVSHKKKCPKDPQGEDTNDQENENTQKGSGNLFLCTFSGCQKYKIAKKIKSRYCAVCNLKFYDPTYYNDTVVARDIRS